MIASIAEIAGENSVDIDGTPAIRVGLVGKGIQLSRSPFMHEKEGAAQGLRYSYTLIDTAEFREPATLDAILDAAERAGYAGLNVTHPYKVAVVPLLDELSEAAQTVGAVNTVVFRNGRRIGHNTDLWGFAEAFRIAMQDARRGAVVQIGAGGAGQAVAHALIASGTQRLTIADTDLPRAEALAQEICDKHGKGRAVAAASAQEAMSAPPDGLVNATPVGMASLPGTPVAPDLIAPPMWVADIVYFPLETELLKIARAKGCRVLPGSGMAVFQAVRAFELFTGLTPDPERMKAAFNAFGR